MNSFIEAELIISKRRLHQQIARWGNQAHTERIKQTDAAFRWLFDTIGWHIRSQGQRRRFDIAKQRVGCDG